jgi:hypothetical protein
MMGRSRRLKQLCAELSVSVVRTDAESASVGEFDSHDDNGLRVNEMFDTFHGKVRK